MNRNQAANLGVDIRYEAQEIRGFNRGVASFLNYLCEKEFTPPELAELAAEYVRDLDKRQRKRYQELLELEKVVQRILKP
jgi:hypothetical protein